MKFLRRATDSGLQDKHRVLNSDPSIWMKVYRFKEVIARNAVKDRQYFA